MLFLFLCPATGVFAGAWTQKKGKYYFKISANYFFTKKEFNHNGDSIPIFAERAGFENASFRDINFTAYLEYGLSDRITVVANLPFKTLTSEWDKFIEFTNPDGSINKAVVHESPQTTGFSDLSLSGRYAILNQPFVLSIQSGIKIPLGYAQRPDNDGSPLGTGDVDLEGHLFFGKSLHPLPAYFTMSFGYRFRGGLLQDEILSSAEVGYNFGRFLFKVNLDVIRNRSAPPDLAGMTVVTPLPGGGGVLPSVIVGDQHTTKLSPAIIYQLRDNYALQIEALNILAGKNTTNGTIYSIGLVITN